MLLDASAAVCADCGLRTSDDGRLSFARTGLSETMIPLRRWPVLQLSHYPATVTAVTIDSVAVDLDDLFIDEAKGQISWLPACPNSWQPGDGHVVAYDAGYVTAYQAEEDPAPTGPQLPADIERAVILTAQHLYAMQQREQFDVAALVEEDSDAGRLETRYFNAGRSPGVPGSAQALLEPYRRML